MAQYLEASQSLLGAAQGHSDTISEQWQRIGAAREGKLDDVVHVKVGRGGTVQSVYERTERSSLPNQAGRCVADDEERESMDTTQRAPLSATCQREPERDLKADVEGVVHVHMCEWSRSTAKAAEEESASVCLSEDAQDEQNSAVGTR